jgi:hypothetical protein
LKTLKRAARCFYVAVSHICHGASADLDFDDASKIIDVGEIRQIHARSNRRSPR